MVLPEHLPEKVFAIDLTEDVLDVNHGARSNAVSDVDSEPKAFAIPAPVIDITSTAAKTELNASNKVSFSIPPPSINSTATSTNQSSKNVFSSRGR